MQDIAKYTRNVEEDSTKAEEAFQLMTTLPQEANDIVCISMIKGLQVGGPVGGYQWVGPVGGHQWSKWVEPPIQGQLHIDLP